MVIVIFIYITNFWKYYRYYLYSMRVGNFKNFPMIPIAWSLLHMLSFLKWGVLKYCQYTMMQTNNITMMFSIKLTVCFSWEEGIILYINSYYVWLIFWLNFRAYYTNDTDLGRNGYYMFQKAIEANKQGNYFPVWGTCLGFEMILLFSADF